MSVIFSVPPKLDPSTHFTYLIDSDVTNNISEHVQVLEARHLDR